MAPLFVLSEHYRSADKSGVREYSGGRAASVSLRIFFWLRQKLRCVASRPSVDGKMLAIEPRVRCGAHIPKRNAIHLDGISFWSRIRESNPPPRLGKPMYYRCTNPALHGSCVEFLDIIASFLQKSNRFLAKRKNRASGGRPGGGFSRAWRQREWRRRA